MEADFEKAQEKIEAFKAELKQLKEKYNFGIIELPQYDGQEEYSHSDYHFSVDEYTWYNETVDEILNELKSTE